VQTPTLAMLVDRKLALPRFSPEVYIEVVVRFQGKDDPNKESYVGTWFPFPLIVLKSSRSNSNIRNANSRSRAKQGPGSSLVFINTVESFVF
jgi:DNA topoisomerase IA